VQYPTDIDDWCITDTGICGTPRSSLSDPATGTTRAIYAFRLRRLWGCIHTSLYSDTVLSNPANKLHLTRIQHLRTELENWRASIPPLTPLAGEALSLFTTSDGFDLDYNYALLLLYRVQIIASKGAAIDSIFFECMQAAASICHGYRRQFIGKPTSYTWGALHELFLAGLTYLHCLWTSPAVREATRQDQVSSTCTDCTIVLVVMAERWGAAAPYRDIFEALAGRTMTMMADKSHEKRMLTSTPTQPDGPDAGDMMQWRERIADTGMSGGVDMLLTGLIGDLPSHNQDADAEGSDVDTYAGNAILG
jgi:hypothetical protein